MTRAGLLVASALLVCACRTAVPVLSPLPAGDPRPERLVASWSEAARSRRTLRAVARLAVDAHDGAVRIRGKQVLVVERPARLRVEVLGFLNQTLAVIVTDGERFELFRARERSYETGSVDPELLWREAHLALTPAEVIDLLLGAPLPDPELMPVGAFGGADGEIQLELADPGGHVHQSVAFDADGRLLRVGKRAAGGRSWRAAYADYALVDGIPVAHEIRLDVEPGGTHAEITLHDVELNPELPPGLFQLQGGSGSAG